MYIACRRYRSLFLRILSLGLIAGSAVCWPPFLIAEESPEKAALSEKRLADAVEFLASDEMEGRGLGTAGLDRAAEFIATEFKKAGLKTDLFDGTPYQEFQRTIQTGKRKRNVRSITLEAKNVVGVLEGEGPLAGETIVVGAHYDHLGFGFSPEAQAKKEVYNGADDNASGVAVLIEIARRLARCDKRPPRRIVFVAFSAEERGLVGSGHYVNNPPFPLDDTIAMVNFDMVGRLEDNKLYIVDMGTAAAFEPTANQVNRDYGFEIGHRPERCGASDHLKFHAKSIPAVHFITGIHADMHKTTDDVEKINVRGMRRIADIAADFITQLAETPQRPEYRKKKPASN